MIGELRRPLLSDKSRQGLLNGQLETQLTAAPASQRVHPAPVPRLRASRPCVQARLCPGSLNAPLFAPTRNVPCTPGSFRGSSSPIRDTALAIGPERTTGLDPRSP